MNPLFHTVSHVEAPTFRVGGTFFFDLSTVAFQLNLFIELQLMMVWKVLALITVQTHNLKIIKTVRPNVNDTELYVTNSEY